MTKRVFGFVAIIALCITVMGCASVMSVSDGGTISTDAGEFTWERMFFFEHPIAIITGYNGTSTDLEIPSQTRRGGLPIRGIAEGVFQGKGLLSVTLPDSIIEIAPNAFANNQLKDLDIPHGILDIRSNAFAGNNIVTVAVPSSTVIGQGAFGDADITRFTPVDQRSAGARYLNPVPDGFRGKWYYYPGSGMSPRVIEFSGKEYETSWRRSREFFWSVLRIVDDRMDFRWSEGSAESRNFMSITIRLVDGFLEISDCTQDRCNGRYVRQRGD
jgi:hypothetical protein